MPVFGDEMFSRALRLDSSNTTSLLCLATGLERRGLYNDAIERLRKLVEAEPEHQEGRLRLAVNLERVDRFSEAEPIFVRLVGSATDEWVVSVAYQELAAAYLRRGRLGDAESTLRRGIERLPRDQKLHLQLAFVLDSRRDSRGAIEQLARIDPTAERSDSARFRYSQLPLEALDDERAEVDALARDKLSDLESALGSQPRAES
jgi:tetratricopeptide (TPR) repeat protein